MFRILRFVHLGIAVCLAILLHPPALSKAMAQEKKLLNASYDPTRELYTEINQAFSDWYRSETGMKITIDQAHGGSSKQARSVIDGLNADVVTLALAWDIMAIERAGLIKSGWQARLPYNSVPYTSTLAFLVRKGNPKKIRNWDDLIRPDIQAIVANPKTSGAARWAFLALWGAAADATAYDLSTEEGARTAQSQAASAKDFPAYRNERAKTVVSEFYNNHVPILDTGARGSTVTFAQKQIGDVLVNWENELRLALSEFGTDKFEIIYPDKSILAEPPVAIVDEVVDKRGSRQFAEAYLKFLYSEEAQDIVAQLHYRPRNIATLQKYSADLPKIPLFTIDETFGGWARAHEAFFADKALFDQIYRPAK